ncbi:DciA family protein [Amantichitinum ursilacus]|uniref:DUF721 domain-containing protein n=1 Tax=Amantichitinum ursilacus TaxID=857265 RepID=A0A0N0XI87_9NEIS|nr:DciA family protein [Amantichitinum ursilacus]KPC50442.1 hypothetical protein WG78_17580 [Amantichitinum ursilacus]
MKRRKSHAGFIGENRALVRLSDRVADYNRVLELIRRQLPPATAQACLGVAWSGTTLVIGVNSAAAATRLRYAAPDLIETLAQAGWQATVILPRVQATLREQKPIPPKALHLSEGARQAFDDLKHTVDDPALLEAINKLVNRHKS